MSVSVSRRVRLTVLPALAAVVLAAVGAGASAPVSSPAAAAGSPGGVIGAAVGVEAPPAAGVAGVVAAGAPAGGPDRPGPGGEVVGLRSRVSRTFTGAGGVRTTRVYAASVNYRDASGRWQLIDDTLVAGSSGAVVNRANGYRLGLPAELGSGPVTVGTAAGTVGYQLIGAAGRPRVQGAAATYPGALPGVDVVQTALPDVAKEDLVLRSAAAASSFTYRLGGVAPGFRTGPNRMLVS
jgi:hypothetical protein